MRPPNEALLRTSAAEIPVLPEILFGKAHALVAQGTRVPRIGMGKNLVGSSAAADQVWKYADKALYTINGFNLSEVCWQGPEELLTTARWEDALIIDALARKAALEETGQLGKPQWHAGNSLGFITALINVGSLSLESAIQLGKGRNEGFAYAIAYNEQNGGKTTMVTLDQVNFQLTQEIAQRYQLEVCLINTDTQTVLGGKESDIERATEYLANELPNLQPGGRVVPLPTDIAIHCKYLEPAVPIYERVVKRVAIEPPKNGSVIGGSTVRPLYTPDEIRRELVAQLTHTENWKGIVDFFQQDGVVALTEIGETPMLTVLQQKMFGGNRERMRYPKSAETNKPLFVAHRWYSPGIAA